MEIEGEGYLPKPTPLRSPLAKRNMKKYLASPPLLAKPKELEVLYLYLAISAEAVASVLVKEDEEKI